MSKVYHENYLRRVELVQQITLKHYEPGRLDRCYKAVWRRWVYPLFPCCYETYRVMLGINVAQARKAMREAAEKPASAAYSERTLFDFIY